MTVSTASNVPSCLHCAALGQHGLCERGTTAGCCCKSRQFQIYAPGPTGMRTGIRYRRSLLGPIIRCVGQNGWCVIHQQPMLSCGIEVQA